MLQIGLLSHQLPVLIVVYNLLKYRGAPLMEKLLYFFVLYNGIVILVEQFILLGRLNNFNPIFNIQSFLDTTLFLLILSLILNKQWFIKLTVVVTILFCLFGIIEIMNWNSLYSINTLSNSIGKFLVVISSVYVVYQLSTSISSELNKGHLVIILTFLFYTLLSLVIALFEEIVRENNDSFFEKIWMIQISLGILFNVSLSFGIWLMKK